MPPSRGEPSSCSTPTAVPKAAATEAVSAGSHASAVLLAATLGVENTVAEHAQVPFAQEVNVVRVGPMEER